MFDLLNEVRKMKNELERQDSTKRQLQDDLIELFQTANDDKKLKVMIVQLHRKWVLNEVRKRKCEKDSNSERMNVTEQLNNSLRVLRSRIASASKNHKEKNTRILDNNVKLLNEINRLTFEKHLVNQQIRQFGFSQEELERPDIRPVARRAQSARVRSFMSPQANDETARILEEIGQLRQGCQVLEDECMKFEDAIAVFRTQEKPTSPSPDQHDIEQNMSAVEFKGDEGNN